MISDIYWAGCTVHLQSQLNALTIPKLYSLGPEMKEELIHKNYRKLVILMLVDMEESPDFEEDTFEEPAAKSLCKKDPDHICSVSSPLLPVWWGPQLRCRWLQRLRSSWWSRFRSAYSTGVTSRLHLFSNRESIMVSLRLRNWSRHRRLRTRTSSFRWPSCWTLWGSLVPRLPLSG